MKVPQYQRQNVAFNTQPAYQNQTDIRSYGFGGIEQATQGLSGAIQNYGQEQFNEQLVHQQQVNAINVKNQTANFLTDLNNLNMQNLAKKGINALPGKDSDGNPTPGVYDSVNQGIEALKTKYSGLLDNPVQQQEFSQALMPYIQHSLSSANQHQQQQQVIEDDNASKALQVAYKNNFAVNFNFANSATDDTQKNTFINNADQSVRNMLAQIEADGQRKGLDANAIAVNKASATADMVGDYVKQLAQEDPKSAMQVAQRYQDKFTVDDWDKLQKNIHPQVVRMDAMETSDKLRQLFGVDGEQQAKQVLKEKLGNSPDYFTYAKQLESDYSDDKRFQHEAQTKNYEDTFGQVIDSMRSGGVSAAQSILDNNPNLRPSQRVSIQNFIYTSKARIDKETKGLATPDEKWVNKYILNGELQRDTQILREYQEVDTLIKKGLKPDLTPEQQTKYNLATINLNRYIAIIAGKQQQQSQEQPEQWQGEYNKRFTQLGELHPDWTEQEKYDFMTKYNNGEI